MKRIVLLRHGESVWNKENRFTGWADIDLTAEGEKQAIHAGKILKDKGFQFSQAFTSYLKRANKTLNIVLDQMNLDWIPVEKSWKLNGRHYGALEGLEKDKAVLLYGKELVHSWRRSYNVSPERILKNDSRSPLFDPRYKNIDKKTIPLGESLKDASERILPYWEDTVMSSLKKNDEVLVTAHGNTLRAIVKHIKNISDKDIEFLNIPTATSYVFEFDDDMQFQGDYFILNN